MAAIANDALEKVLPCRTLPRLAITNEDANPSHCPVQAKSFLRILD
jgi:hypothetical protein